MGVDQWIVFEMIDDSIKLERGGNSESINCSASSNCYSGSMPSDLSRL